MSIAERLKHNREESDMTVEQVADKLGVPDYLVKYLEDPDGDNPELEVILAEAVGVQWSVGGMAFSLTLVSIAFWVFSPRLRRLD